MVTVFRMMKVYTRFLVIERFLTHSRRNVSYCTFPGIAGLIWYCLWLWLAFEKPSLHPCISGKELKYIEDSLGQGQGQVMMPMPTFATTPWRSIATSMPVYAIIVANFCRSWNFYLLVLFQNRFLHESFKMNLLEVK